MEVPTELKTLYKHWETHTQIPQNISATNQIKNKPKHNAQPIQDTTLPINLIWFITERMNIYEKKHEQVNPPYTNDTILQKYRFCNIYRELDRQTIEIHTKLKELEDNFELWLLNMAFHRLVCNPKTCEQVGRLNFDQVNNKKVYKNLINLPKPKYGSAYVFPISVIQRSPYPTREEFFCFYLPQIMPHIAQMVQQFKNATVNEGLRALLPLFGYNFRFHWAEILIDVAYQYPSLINLFEDFYVGPGALPTAKQVNPHKKTTEVIDDCVIAGVKTKSALDAFPYLTYHNKPVYLSAENWEGIFCEYRKYTNLRKGKGRVRRYTT